MIRSPILQPTLVVLLIALPWGAGLGCGDDGSAADIDDSGQGGDPPSTTCATSEDCLLRPDGCCAVCGQPTAADVRAVTRQEDEAQRAECAGEQCGSCGSLLNPHLQPVCAAARCTVFDSGDDPIRDCEVDADCAVRSPDCCGCGNFDDPHALIAINGGRHDDYAAARCPDLPNIACEPCDPAFPGDVSAACDQGRCATVIPTR